MDVTSKFAKRITIHGVSFDPTVQPDGRTVNVSTFVPGFETTRSGSLALLIGVELVRELPAAEREVALRAGREFSVNGCYAIPTTDDPDDATNPAPGAMSWLRLAGELPPLNDSYHLGTPFCESMVIPREAFIELARRVDALEADLANGTLDPALLPATVPPPPSLPAPHPVLVQYERLGSACRSEHEAFEVRRAFVLQVMRGEPWTPLPPEPVDEPYEDVDDDDDEPPIYEPHEEAHVTQVSLDPITPPQHIASAEILRELEAMAIELDRLDEIARGEEDNYPDEETSAPCEARRRRVLLELEVAGLFERELASEARKAVAELPALRGYHDAAMELHAYLDSPERAAVVSRPRPARIVESLVSIDWFRRPAPAPDGIAPHAWLALGEREFEDRLPKGDGGGRRFTTLGGHGCILYFRAEARTTMSLWRAGGR